MPLRVEQDEIRKPEPPRRGWSPAALAAAVGLHGAIVAIAMVVGAWSRPGALEDGTVAYEIVVMAPGGGDAGSKDAAAEAFAAAVSAPEAPPQVTASELTVPVTPPPPDVPPVVTAQELSVPVQVAPPDAPPAVSTAELTPPLETQLPPLPPEPEAIAIAPPVPTPPPAPKPPVKQQAAAAPPPKAAAPTKPAAPAQASAAPAPTKSVAPPAALGHDRGGETAGAGAAETAGASVSPLALGVLANPGYARAPTPPHYPPIAIDRNLQGTVLVRALLRGGGRADDVQVHRSSGYDMLDRAAIAAVRTWEFLPARNGGQVVAAWVEVPVHFRLR